MQRVERVIRWVGFGLYALLVLALVDWTGMADVRWPWKGETPPNTPPDIPQPELPVGEAEVLRALEQARQELERIQQEAEEARQRREEEERHLAKIKEEQEHIEAKSREEEQKLKVAEEQRKLAEQKLRQTEQRRKEAEAGVLEAERKAQGEAEQRREELRLASIINTEIQDNFNRSQIQQLLERERTDTSWRWRNTFTNNIVLVEITKTSNSRTSPCREFKVSLVGKHTQVDRVKRACRDKNGVWRW